MDNTYIDYEYDFNFIKYLKKATLYAFKNNYYVNVNLIGYSGENCVDFSIDKMIYLDDNKYVRVYHCENGPAEYYNFDETNNSYSESYYLYDLEYKKQEFFLIML